MDYYVHNTLQHEMRYDLSLMCDSFESTFIELTNNPKCKKTVIGVVYRPPGQDIDAFLQIFLSVLNNINPHSCNCFILGDFNLDLTKTGQDSKVDSFLNLLSSFYLHPLID